MFLCISYINLLYVLLYNLCLQSAVHEDLLISSVAGEGHLTGGHRSFLKPAGHNTWRDDQPITVDEGSGTSTRHVIVIEVSEILLN
uniref:Secreted protein n=1 Tax=Hucho hucho TaxID=62062 RepID=A0A4W5PW89_9TELE